MNKISPSDPLSNRTLKTLFVFLSLLRLDWNVATIDVTSPFPLTIFSQRIVGLLSTTFISLVLFVLECILDLNN